MFQSETLSRMGVSGRGLLDNIESEDDDAPLGSAKAEKGRLDALSAIEGPEMGISDWFGGYGKRSRA